MSAFHDDQLAKLVRMAAEAQLRGIGNPVPQLAPEAIAAKYGLTVDDVTQRINERKEKIKNQ